MKGFIEVTLNDDEKVSMSIDSITFFCNNLIVQYGNTPHACHEFVKESYEEIKELIKQAQ